ncbi:S41 family peptidase [Novosphingobium sp. Gsoil 351]|uniref:S41 family peptidase n=1 Tax=Novosphingobium sp. Gsoil 351 TaxID=2675225 RepID=UPI0012B46AB4|nr:S41 family peptidase [Novosphingobium sp. Gsoil 351]QGN55961.1 peptidase S41 [Novosphingobium sp. Gsoil 351]
MVSLVAALASCGGGGSSGAPPVAVTPAPTSGATPTPTPTPSGCSLSERKAWALSQLQEWYLFPESLDTTVNPASYATVQDYIDALVAPARAQSKDRFFTHLASIAEENAFFNSGSSAGFGIRLTYDTTAKRVFVVEAFEGAPALSAGIDRGTEIVAIGTSAGNLQTVTALMQSGGAQAVVDALGPTTAGTTRVLRVITNGAQLDLTVTKADYALLPVSSRYGVKVIDNGGTKVGYVNLRTFIDTADPALRNAFATFKSQGVTQVIVDLRYNGGGLVSIAELFGDLMGADKVGQTFSFTTFRASKSSNNDSDNFSALSQAIAATKIAFIGTTGTASASELLINAFTPYLHANSALIGTNTFGKPVGQIALDKASCDDRLRPIAFRTENSAHQGDYYTGLASRVEATCSAGDDYTKQLGDPAEASVKVALDFLAGRTCNPISGGGQTTLAAGGNRNLVQPNAPSTLQREVPGAF